MPRKALTVAVAILVCPAAASANPTPLAPPDGAVFEEGDTITFEWELPPGERSDEIELAASPTETGFIEFYDIPSPSATQLSVPNWDYGIYYWRVITDGPGMSIDTPSQWVRLNVLDLMSRSQARWSIKKAIRRELPQGLYPLFTMTRNQCRVTTDFDARCKWSGGYGDVFYKGRAHVFVSGPENIEDNVYDFHVRGRYRHINYFCLYVDEKPDSKCIDRRKMKL
jgi:hypothetical protein